MSNLRIVLCLALFVSTENAFSWTYNPKAIQHLVQQATEYGISKFAKEYEDSLIHVGTEAIRFSQRTVNFSSSIMEELRMIAENLSNELKFEVAKAEEANVKVDDCSPPEDTETLGKLAKDVYERMVVCNTKNQDKALAMLEGIRKTSNDALVKLDDVIQKSKLCSSDEKSATEAISCSGSSAVAASGYAMKPAAGLAINWGKYKVYSLTLESRLYSCISRRRDALHQKTSEIRARTTKCIQDKINTAKAAALKSH